MTPPTGSGFPTPSLLAVFRRQLGLLFPGPFLMLFAILVPMLIPLQVWRIRGRLDSFRFEQAPAVAQLLEMVWFVGLVWALLVWREEGGERRSYHRSLPVDGTLHDLARVAAGGLCLVVCLLIATGLGLIVSALEGSWYLTAQITPRWWLNALTAPLLMYLLGSVFGMGTSRPVERMAVAGGAVLGVSLVLVLLADSSRAFDFVVEEWLGFRWMAQGGFASVLVVEDLRFAGLSSWALYGDPVTLTEFATATLAAFAVTIGGLIWIARRKA